MIGTVVGTVVIVVLTACFPQDRALFLVALALWVRRAHSSLRFCELDGSEHFETNAGYAGDFTIWPGSNAPSVGKSTAQHISR
jgi:hypothetical protein